jgi:hypothetical protein
VCVRVRCAYAIERKGIRGRVVCVWVGRGGGEERERQREGGRERDLHGLLPRLAVRTAASASSAGDTMKHNAEGPDVLLRIRIIACT